MTAAPFKNIEVLVVDDEDAIREGLRVLLQEWGFQVMTAATAAQAEAAVAALVREDVGHALGHGAIEVVLRDRPRRAVAPCPVEGLARRALGRQ